MDFFETIAGSGAPRAEDAEVKIDLRGSKKEEALHKLSHMMDYCRRTAALSLLVRFDPATEKSGETLFPHIGRALKEYKRQGVVEGCYPVMEKDSGGFFVYFRR